MQILWFLTLIYWGPSQFGVSFKLVKAIEKVPKTQNYIIKMTKENCTQESLKYRYEKEDIINLFLDDVVHIICETAAFQRLRGISFLGAVEKTPTYSMRRQNRFDHSIGVALLAQHYAVKLGFSEKDRIKVIIAALLHDIGHAPLSHSLEPFFVEKFGLDHHIATNNILQGKVALGKDLSNTLSKNSIDVDTLIHLMSGADDSKLGRIFSSPINIDTMEAIWRGGSYFNKRFVYPLSVLDAFIAEDFKSNSLIDRFWNEKNTFYWLMIYSKDGVAADHWARERIWSASNKITTDDFYLTEKRFLSKYPNEISEKTESTILNVKVRTFEVNENESISCYNGLSKRYTIIRGKKSILIDPPVKKIESQIQPSFFEI